MTQFITAVLRTVVPSLWGSFIAWLLGIAPLLEPLRGQLLAYADVLVPILTAVIIGAWYALWRWLQPRLPDWLVRILLGSAKAPIYRSPDTIPGEAVAGGTVGGGNNP